MESRKNLDTILSELKFSDVEKKAFIDSIQVVKDSQNNGGYSEVINRLKQIIVEVLKNDN